MEWNFLPYFNLFVRGDSLILFSGEKNEPFGLPFLLTPPSYGHLPYILWCKTQGTARAEFRSSSLFICDFSISTPSPCGHSPYIPLRKHRGRGGLTLLLPLQVFLTPLLVATLLSSPLYFALQNTGEEGNTSFGNEVRFYCFAVRIPWCYGAGERLKRFFCSLSKGGV